MLNEMDSINLANLRGITEQARMKRESGIRSRTEAQRKSAEARAKRIIKGIPARAERAARGEETSLVVMVLNETRDYERESGFFHSRLEDRTRLDPSRLIGSARIVYDYLRRSKAEPTLVFNYDGEGIKPSWFDMKISW